jgi:CBS domain-containing protein
MDFAELDSLADRAKRGEDVKISGRQLLGWFGASRRGSSIVAWIRSELAIRAVVTDPDFNDVWVDIPIRLKPAAAEHEQTSGSAANGASAGAGEPPVAGEAPDPVERIGRLPAANQEVVSVPPGTPIATAMTVMMLRDFSQLPVIHGERDCKGAVTWQSMASTSALGHPCVHVGDCLVPVEEVGAKTALFDAIPKIVKEGFVLVRSSDRSIQGIVTVADLSLQFRALSEPFLLLGQIENLLRKLATRSFTREEIQAAKNPGDEAREVQDASNLTFGECVRLLEPADAWPRLKLLFDRDPFLDEVRRTKDIRNEVMHFDPDPLEESDLVTLRNLARFLERVVR